MGGFHSEAKGNKCLRLKANLIDNLGISTFIPAFKLLSAS